MPDNLTKAQRSYCMSRIKGKDTGLEKKVYAELRRKKIRFRKYVKTLPGKPDIVFFKEKVIVFIDGDFWHGYRFPLWKHKVSSFWQKKISKNRDRDRRNHCKLRGMGWKVIRLWQHKIKRNIEECIDKIESAVCIP